MERPFEMVTVQTPSRLAGADGIKFVGMIKG